MFPSTSHQATLRFVRWFALIAIALIGATSLLLSNAHAASAQTCVNDVTGVSNNCTANDVRIAEITVLPGSPDVVCTSDADTVTVLLQTRLRAGANTRYDIGLFIATDGGDAFTGSCARAYLTPTLSSNVGISLTSGVGPFYNGEIGTGDTCGDVQQNTDTLYNLPPVTLRCRDADGDGDLDVGSIVVWDNTTNNLCTSLEDAVPNNKAKCNSDTVLRIPISVPPSDVRITKTPDAPAVNAGSQIGFTIVVTNTQTGSGFGARADNVRITDTLPAGFVWVEASDPSNACNVSLTNPRVLTCNWGNLNAGASRSVRVTAPTTITNCGAVPNVVNLTYSSGNPRVLRSSQASATTIVACSNIEVDKNTAPSGSAQPFTFRIRNGATTLQTFSLTDTQDVFVSGNLTPTLTYVVEEDTPVGWQLSSAACDNDNPPSAVQPLSAPAPGEPALGTTVRCTFTNTQLVSVQAIKTVIGASGAFSMTLAGQPDRSVSAAPGAPGEAVWDNLQPGEYTIGEVDPGNNWILGDFACTIYQADGEQRSDDATFSLAAGERAVCEITNTRRGSIIVQKQTEPAANDASFVFAASFEPSFSLIGGQSFNSGLLNPGVYTVTEMTLPAGWDVISATCSDGSPVDAITLQAGETITCTFVNRQRSSITLVKQTIGFGGENFDGSFAFTSTGGLTTTDPFILETTDTTAQVVFANLLSGAYSIVEQEQAEWQPVSASCTGANSDDPTALFLGPGQAATCTFVNQRLIADIRLVKEVTTVDDAACANTGDLLTAPPNTPVLYCFTIENTGNIPITAPITLADPAINFVEILPISEIEPGAAVEYTRTHNWGEARGLYPNTATATGVTSLGIVSDEDSALVSILEPVLAVQKLVGEDGQFYATTTGSPYLTNAGNNLQWRWLISNTGNVTVTLTVTDTLDGEDFDFTASGCALPATLEPGEGFICNSNLFSATVGQHTNVLAVTGCADTQAGQVCGTAGDLASYITRPQLTVTKSVSNIWGGLLGVDDFPLQLSDGDVVTPLVSGGVINLDAGSYTVSEVQQPGYTTAGVAGDCSANGAITMVNGETYACTITNQDTPARVSVTKVVVSERLDDSFDIYLNGAVIDVATGIGETFGPFDIVSGTHTISETGNLSEYITEIGGDCDANGMFTATIGVTYSCTITNTRLGSIVVVKQTEPAGGSQGFDFTADYSPGGFMLSDGQSSNSGFLAPGVYAITETIPAGWEQRPSTCSNGDSPSAVTLNAGAIVTCTFSNRQLGQIRIEKRTDPAGSAQTFDFTANYDFGGFRLGHGEANTSAFLTTGFYTVTEVTPLPTGWSQTGFVCDDTDSSGSGVNLAPGELVTCVITNTIQRGQIIVDKFTDPAQSAQVFSFTTDFVDDFGLADLTPAFVSGPLLPVSERGVNYSVNETLPGGWTQESAICLGNDGREVNPSSIDLQPGETVTCEFTNRINRGQIIVEKITAPANSTQPFSFTANFTDSFELRGGESITTGFNLLPTSEGGVYSVNENTPAGWIVTAETCSDGSSPDNVTLEPGESVTCTFTNTLGLARIRFEEPTATNAVNQPHVFTVTVETSSDNGAAWESVAGQVVTGTASGVGSPALQTCTTDSSGQCTLTINSTTAGQTTLVASTVVNVLGLDIPVTTNGDTGQFRNAVKRWVDLRVRIDPQRDTNPLNEPHTFTISVTQNLGDGVWIPVADGITATVTVAPQPNGFTPLSDSCAITGTVNGVCTVIINSTVAQVYTADAIVTVDVAGETITRSTQGDQANLDAGGTGPAIKTYQEGAVAIEKTVDPTYTRTFTWVIEKNATPDTLHIFDGADASVGYTVAVTKSDGDDSNFAISGIVTFTNITTDPVILNTPVDTLADGTPITLNCGQAQFPYTLLQETPLVCTYSQPFAGALDTTNLVTVTTTSGSVFTTTAVVDFGAPTALVNDSIQVTDTNTTTVWSTNFSDVFPYNQTFSCENVADEEYTNGVTGYTFDNTAQVRYDEGDGPADTETVNVNCYRPSVSKTAEPSHVITHTWDIIKTANVTDVHLFDGDGQTVIYTIEAVKDGGAPGSWAVSGVVTVRNPNPNDTIPVANLSDALSIYGAVTLDCGDASVVPAAVDNVPGILTCSYSQQLASGAAQTNTATLVLYGRSYTDTAPFSFDAKDADKVHDSLTVTDTIAGPWTFNGSGSRSYERPLACEAFFGDDDYGSDGTTSTDLLNVAVGRGDNDALLDQDDETVTLTCYRPIVTKTANTAFTRTYNWTVEKDVDTARLDLFDGETATVTYTVNVVKSDPVDSAFRVNGVISINNPHPSQAATFDVEDVLPGGLVAQVTCGAGGNTVTVDPGQTATCTYTASPSGVISGDNVVTATMQTDSGARSYTGSAAVIFGAPTTVIDDQVGISDTNPAFGEPLTTSSDFNREYQVTYGCEEVDFSEGTTFFEQQINTVTVDKTVDASDTATVDLTCYLPTVTKRAQGAYSEVFDWTLVKNADPAQLDLFEGESQVVTYTIDVVKTLAAQQGFAVNGGIVISNPNPLRSLPLAAVVDQLHTGQVLPNNCAAFVPAGQMLTCAYGDAVEGVNASSIVTNVATITTPFERSYASAPQTVNFADVTPSTLNDNVTIVDSQTDETWPMSGSGTISYALTQGCADITFTGDSTVYNDTLINTASVRELSGRTSTATVDLSCYRLAVSKDANTTFTRQYFWGIEKTVDRNAWDIFAGDQITPSYTVTPFIIGQQDSNWLVQGTIAISNPAPMPANVTSVVDVLPNGMPAAVSCASGVTVPANSTVACTYSAQPGGVINGANTVTATLQTNAGANKYAGTAVVAFDGPTTEIDKTVSVTDDLYGALGEFTNGQSESYDMSVACENVVFGEGETSQVNVIVNTATIDETDISDSESVTVTCWKPPVIKTVNTRYNRVYDYAIVKTVEPVEQTIYFTDTATFTYTLQVTKFVKEENGFAVGGAIVIDNPAPIGATLASIEDILPDAANMTIVCAPDNEAPYTVPAGGALTCTYSADLPDKTFRINEARATMSNGVVLSATAPVDFSTAVVTPINDTAPISDTFWSEAQTVFTDTLFTYTEEFTCAGLAYNQETGFFSGAFTNIAEVLLEGGASDSATVTLNCYRLDLSVEKTATPTERPEPGGSFTFDVAVVNNSPVPVTLTSLTDDIYGDITQVSGRMVGTTCALPQTLPANGGEYSCSFTADFTGQPGATETDTVTASGVDSAGTPVEASDSATVTITNVPSSITLTKTANQTVLPWPGGDVIFTVAVQNTSAVDAVRIDTLTDSIYGNITQVGGKLLATTCAVPQVLPPGAIYSCAFTVNLTLPADADANLVETNVATATGIDDDGQSVQASDDETVTVTAAQRGVIGNRVFIDIDPSGINSAARLAGNQQQDYGEDGQPVENNVPGIDILLFTADGKFVAQTKSDEDGDYRFVDVPPGDYYVVFVNNGVFMGVWTGYNAAIADDINSDVDPGLPLNEDVQAIIDQLLGEGASRDAARTPIFSLAPGQTYLDLDAGLIDLSGVSSVDISGIIWLDANRDGIRQPDETVRIQDILVELFRVNDNQPNEVAKVDQRTTGVDGHFEFLGLDTGIYFVRMTITNLQISPKNVGDDDTIDSDIDPVTGESDIVTLSFETITIDAGVYQTPTALDPTEEPVIMSHRLFLPAVQR